MKNNKNLSPTFPGQFSDWNLYGSPLRPCHQDIAFLNNYLMQWRQNYQRSSIQSILLGVTPEIAEAFSKDKDQLTAVDISKKMIEKTWLGDTPNRTAIEGSWFNLPSKDNAVDVVLGDGILSIINFPTDTMKLIKEAHRVLKKDGTLLLRCFCRPSQKESPTQVLSDLKAKKIGSFHAFKWRLMMALHEDDPINGIAVTKAWDWFHTTFPNEADFSSMTGWPIQVIDTIRVYQNNPSVYSFPSTKEINAEISQYFECVNIEYGDYELADRCPTITLKPLK